LTSMEERAQRIGGRLDIRSAQGEGTTVRLDV
jgi:signal transduction histidine kinase